MNTPSNSQQTTIDDTMPDDFWDRVAFVRSGLGDDCSGWRVRVYRVVDGSRQPLADYPLDSADALAVQAECGGGRYFGQVISPGGHIRTGRAFSLAEPPPARRVGAVTPPAPAPAAPAAPAIDTNQLLMLMMQGQQQMLTALATRPPIQGVGLGEVLPLIQDKKTGIAQLREALELVSMVKGDADGASDDDDGEGGGVLASIAAKLGRSLAERMSENDDGAPQTARPSPNALPPSPTNDPRLPQMLRASMHWTARLVARVLESVGIDWKSKGPGAVRPFVAQFLPDAPAWWVNGVIQQLTGAAGAPRDVSPSNTGSPAPAKETTNGEANDGGEHGGKVKPDAGETRDGEKRGGSAPAGSVPHNGGSPSDSGTARARAGHANGRRGKRVSPRVGRGGDRAKRR